VALFSGYNPVIMEITCGQNLGMLHQQLGIDPKARVTFQLTPTGGVVSDYSTGTAYTLTFGQTTRLVKSSIVVPQWAEEIFSATDDVLKKRWKETNGWDDQRETVFAELTLRGVRILDIDLGHDG
jgi:hypothetical protein